MAGGGKGGSQTTEVKIPEWLEQGAQKNMARGEEISRIGYTPYHGADVAALTPMQQAGMHNTNQAASAFGTAQSADPMAGMPQQQTFAGGVQGYSSGGLYDQAIAELQSRNPAQFDAIMAQFINPQTGAAALAAPVAAPEAATDPWARFRSSSEGRNGGGGEYNDYGDRTPSGDAGAFSGAARDAIDKAKGWF